MEEVTVTSAPKKSKVESTSIPEGASRMVVIDIGEKQKKKAIRRLRQGRGRLVAKVEDAVRDIREETGSNSPVVVVIVRKKRKARRWLW